MSEETIKLLQLIKEGKTCNEICLALNISNKQLFNRLTILKNKGLFYSRKYCSNGVIIYKPISSISNLNNYIIGCEDSIITPNKDKNFRCLVISDLHFGNKLERLDLLDRAFNYCIKNNIHIIFCCGDMIDGTFGKSEKGIIDIYSQIEHFIKDYPFDKNILTFAVGGDHDLDGIDHGFQDIIEITNNYRHDIIIRKYNNRIINIKNDSIQLFHHTRNGKMLDFECPIILHGHSHKYITYLVNSKVLNISVPSLSDVNDSLPTAIDLKLEFEKGYINYAILNQIYFGDKDYILNEQRYNLLENREVEIKPIKNEDGFKIEDLTVPDLITHEAENEKIKILQKKDSTKLSQVEKFNKKYGL